MTREELRELVNKELGSTRLTISEQTINGELDDELENYGDNEESNSKLVSKLAKRLKRMDGNLHSEFSKQKKINEENAEKRRKEEESKKSKEDKNSKDDDMPEWAKRLQQDLEEERNARKAEQVERAKNATMESVKNGLKEKFDKAGLKLNSFFAKSALAKLEIPDEGVDITSLVEKAERLYNADIKEAGVTIDKPRNGGTGGSQEKPNEHEWDDVAKLRSRDNPNAEGK